MSKTTKNITIYDIAKEAGCSVSTVSRVLTGSAPVKEKTKSKILRIIEAYNYHPNALARSLLHKKSGMIGLVVPDITHSFFSTMFVHIETRALELGYTTFLCNTMYSHELESKYLVTLMEKQVDGVIFMGGRINESAPNETFAREMNQVMRQMPLVMVSGKMEGVRATVVRSDEQQGVHDLLYFLLRLGHERIAWIGGTIGNTSTDVRLDAFNRFLRENKLTIPENWYIHNDFTIESGEQAMKELLKNPHLPTAVVCINDLVAIGAMRFLHRNGFTIPVDMSIVGFDDMPVADLVYPGITSVTHNYERLARTTIDTLVGVINGRDMAEEQVIQTDLVIRGSCARHRTTAKE